MFDLLFKNSHDFFKSHECRTLVSGPDKRERARPPFWLEHVSHLLCISFHPVKLVLVTDMNGNLVHLSSCFLNFPWVICHCIWRDGYLLICPEVKCGKKSCEEKRTEDRNWFYILQGQFQFAQIHFKAMYTFSIMFFSHSILSNALCQSIIFSRYYNSLYFLILLKKSIRNHYLMRWTIPAEAWQNNIWAVIQLPDPFKRFCHTWAETFSMLYQVCSFTSECSSENLILSASKAPTG